MKLLRHPVASLVLFAVLIGLCIGIYESFETNYGIVKGDIHTTDRTTGNIMEQFKSMNLIEGIADLENAILKLSPPAGSNVEFDILGGLAQAGIGAFKIVIGLITTPFEFLSIIITFYTEVPSILVELSMLVVVYVAFILMRLWLKEDI